MMHSNNTPISSKQTFIHWKRNSHPHPSWSAAKCFHLYIYTQKSTYLLLPLPICLPQTVRGNDWCTVVNVTESLSDTPVPHAPVYCTLIMLNGFHTTYVACCNTTTKHKMKTANSRECYTWNLHISDKICHTVYYQITALIYIRLQMSVPVVIMVIIPDKYSKNQTGGTRVISLQCPIFSGSEICEEKIILQKQIISHDLLVAVIVTLGKGNHNMIMPRTIKRKKSADNFLRIHELSKKVATVNVRPNVFLRNGSSKNLKLFKYLPTGLLKLCPQAYHHWFYLYY